MTGERGDRSKELLSDIKGITRYWKLKKKHYITRYEELAEEGDLGLRKTDKE